ncbi:MAG TPA: hypothetical protein VI136_10615 [Verrucomicrobiae bacterium]
MNPNPRGPYRRRQDNQRRPERPRSDQPWQGREQRWEPPKPTSKPTEVMELKEDVLDAIEAHRTEDVQKALYDLQRGGRFFPPNDWADFADAAVATNDPAMLDTIWDGSQSQLNRFEFWDLRRFAHAAIHLGNERILTDVFKTASAKNVRFTVDQWALLADVVAGTENGKILSALWTSTGSSRGFFGFQELGRFAAASVATRNPHVLSEVMDAIYRVGFLPPSQWSSLVDAAILHPNSDVAYCLWNASESSRNKFWAVTFGQFASLAAAVKEPSLLERVFDAWPPSADTLGGEYPEHSTWAAFFRAADELGDEGLIFKFFCRLETLYDPVRYRRRGVNGSLQNQLKDIRTRMSNKALATEITAIMHGDRWELHKFFLNLIAYPPNSDARAPAARFEGAARCLMQWLINRFFTESAEGFQTALGRVTDGIMALPRNQAEAWFALLCRGQQNYGGNIAARYREFFQQHLAFVGSLSGSELLAKLTDGTLTDAVGKFELSCKAVAPWPDNEPQIQPESRATKLLPAIEAIAENCANSIHYVEADEISDLWVKLKSLCDAAKIEEFDRKDWTIFLTRLLWVVSWRVAQAMESYLGIQVHGLKNRFLDEFQKPLNELSEEEQLELATYARSFLLNAHQRLQRRGKGDAVPVKLTSLVERCLVTGGPNFLGKVFVKPKDDLWISAWEGAKRDIVEPLLQELAFNCAKALEAMPPKERFLRIILETDQTAKSAALTIQNPIPESSKRNPHSTRMGQRYVRRMAGVLLGDPNKEDAATFGPQFEESMGCEVFVTRVVFPLGTAPPAGVADNDE